MKGDAKNKIIPINRKMLESLQKVLNLLGDQRWVGPERFNAIFIDRKGFMKHDLVTNPPPPYYYFAVMPKIEFTLGRAELNTAKIEKVEFRFFSRIGDVVHYREDV